MQFLKADTQVKVVIGPVVAVGDGFTPVTTLALGTADEAELMKHDAASVTDISGNTFAAITNMDGYYNLTLTTGNTDTEGMLTVGINDDSLCLPVIARFTVVNANVYDSLFAAAATDYLQVDAVQVGGATEDVATETKQDVIDSNVDAILVDTGTTLDGKIDTIDGNVDAVLVDTAALDGRLTDARAGYIDELAAANLPTDIANVKAETALIVADTNELQTDWANGGRLDTLLDTTVSQTVAATIADAVLDEVVDANAPANCNSLRENVNVIAAAVAGKCSGVDTDTPTFRDLGDTKNRLVTAIDANDNRTASTPDGT